MDGGCYHRPTLFGALAGQSVDGRGAHAHESPSDDNENRASIGGQSSRRIRRRFPLLASVIPCSGCLQRLQPSLWPVKPTSPSVPIKASCRLVTLTARVLIAIPWPDLLVERLHIPGIRRHEVTTLSHSFVRDRPPDAYGTGPTLAVQRTPSGNSRCPPTRPGPFVLLPNAQGPFTVARCRCQILPSAPRIPAPMPSACPPRRALCHYSLVPGHLRAASPLPPAGPPWSRTSHPHEGDDRGSRR